MKPDAASDILRGRTAVLATQHGKERALRSLFLRSVGLRLEVPHHLDTDVWGTFSGEVERPADPISTLRMKIDMAVQATGYRVGVGTEGSFGPHPELPWVPGHQEIVMVRDYDFEGEWFTVYTSTETNYSAQIAGNQDELWAFARQANFPSHALILKAMKDNRVIFLKKAIQKAGELREVAAAYWAQGYQVAVETDMRAHLNPTRMKNIRLAARQLVYKLKTFCPHCAWPGFDRVDRTSGLPCQQCGQPTRVARQWVWGCMKCGYREVRPVAEAKADPRFCDSCNP